MSIFGPFHHRRAPALTTGSLCRTTRALQLGPLRLDAGAEVRLVAPRDLGDAVAANAELAAIATPTVAGERPIAGG